jgi:hypothetical protein
MSILFFGRSVDVRIGPAGGVGRSFKDLKIEFEVNRSLGRDPNTASVSLWNVDSVSLGIITALGAKIQVLAGYGQIPSLIFNGDIAKRGVVIEKQDADEVVTIEAGDGELAYSKTRFDRSFVAGTDNNTILSLILASMGLGLGPGSPALPPKVYGSDVTFFGMAREAVDEIVKDVGAQWSVQDGNVVLLLNDQQVTAEGAELLTSNTGMVGSPTRTDEGVNVDSLLNPRIRPGKALSIVSRAITGFYKAMKVRHSGDNYGADFTTQIEAIPIG